MRYSILNYIASLESRGELTVLAAKEVSIDICPLYTSSTDRVSKDNAIVGPIPRFREENVLTSLLRKYSSAPAPADRNFSVEVEQGLLVCGESGRWYPIINFIPEILPDNLRDWQRDIAFLDSIADTIPSDILKELKESATRFGSVKKENVGDNYKKAEMSLHKKVSDPANFFSPGYISPFNPGDSFYAFDHINGFAAGVALLGPRQRSVILDVGSGYSWTTEWLQKAGFEPIGIDVSRVYLDIGLKRMGNLRPHLIVADVENIPIRDTSVDSVLSFDSFHHVPNRHKAMSEFSRILKNDGTIALVEPGAGHEKAAVAIEVMRKYGTLEKGMELSDIESYIAGTGLSSPMQHFLVTFNMTEMGQLLDNSFVSSRGRFGWNVFSIRKTGKSVIAEQKKGLSSCTISSLANAANTTTPGEVSDEIQQLCYKPVFSVVVPVYNTGGALVDCCIQSVLNQFYPYFELCIHDNNSTNADTIDVLNRYKGTDPRIKIVRSARNLEIAGGQNKAAMHATGDYIAFLDSDDEIPRTALYEAAKALNADPDIDLIYTDEDKIELDGTHSEHYFKPDWSPEHLLSCMYVLHFLIIRKELFFKLGMMRSEYTGSQDYDLALRVASVTDKVHHIPKVLYHWRKTPGSAAAVVDAKPYALEASRRALQDHIKRNNMDAQVVDGKLRGLFRVKHRIRNEPLVSVVIPTDYRERSVPGRGEINLLMNFLKSVVEKTDYQRYEIVIVDNYNLPGNVRNFLRGIRHNLVSFREVGGRFNFAETVNFAVKHAKGDHILLANDDLEVISCEWLRALLEFSQQKEIGAVGGRLLFPENRIQHCGMVLGVNYTAAHVYHSFPADLIGYNAYTHLIRNYLAVTAACMMTRREVFEEVGGFDENFAIDFNDVDYCLRAFSRGYRIVYTPFCELYHFEQSSFAGRTQNPKEHELFLSRWKQYVDNDPYYNVNLSRTRFDFSLREESPVPQLLTSLPKETNMKARRVAEYGGGCWIDILCGVRNPHIQADELSAIPVHYRFTVNGWAVDRENGVAPPQVFIWLRGQRDIYIEAIRGERPDVATALDNPNFTPAGFFVDCSAAEIPDGRYQILVLQVAEREVIEVATDLKVDVGRAAVSTSDLRYIFENYHSINPDQIAQKLGFPVDQVCELIADFQNTKYEGYIDLFRNGNLLGWACDYSKPGQRVKVSVYCQGRHIGDATANLFREDLRRAGIGDGSGTYGFLFPIPPDIRSTKTYSLQGYVNGVGELKNSPFEISEERMMSFGVSYGPHIRDFLASQFISGKGIEIGALQNPTNVPAGTIVKYVDSKSTQELVSYYAPAVEGRHLVNVDHIADAHTLCGIPDESQDFVIANHLLEHLENPLLALENMFRVLRFGGVMLLSLPDKKYTFDVDRPTTTFEHILEDYRCGPEKSRLAHYEEWVRLMEKITDPTEAQIRVRQLIDVFHYPIHFHVWSKPEMFMFFEGARKVLRVKFEIDCFKGNGEEALFILKKAGAGS